MDSRIFNHKGGLLNGNAYVQQFPRRDPYLQPGQPIMEESLYREQPQMTRNDWQLMQQQAPPQLPPVKPQSNSVWPEKLVKQVPSDEKPARKKGKDAEYSEDYSEESQSEGDDATTTEAPKKVKVLNATQLFLYTFKLLEATKA